MAKGNGSMWLMRSYNFVDKDPECDRFRTLYQKQHIKESDLAVLAGLSATTVKNMFGGKTRKPQHTTFAKMAGAMGHEYGLQLVKTPDYAAEIPVAKQQYKEHKARLAAKRKAAAKKKK